jgi:hypothetical protein
MADADAETVDTTTRVTLDASHTSTGKDVDILAFDTEEEFQRLASTYFVDADTPVQLITESA